MKVGGVEESSTGNFIGKYELADFRKMLNAMKLQEEKDKTIGEEGDS